MYITQDHPAVLGAQIILVEKFLSTIMIIDINICTVFTVEQTLL